MIDHEKKEILLTIDLDKLRAIGVKQIKFLLFVVWALTIITAVWLIDFA